MCRYCFVIITFLAVNGFCNPIPEQPDQYVYSLICEGQGLTKRCIDSCSSRSLKPLCTIDNLQITQRCICEYPSNTPDEVTPEYRIAVSVAPVNDIIVPEVTRNRPTRAYNFPTILNNNPTTTYPSIHNEYLPVDYSRTNNITVGNNPQEQVVQDSATVDHLDATSPTTGHQYNPTVPEPTDRNNSVTDSGSDFSEDLISLAFREPGFKQVVPLQSNYNELQEYTETSQFVPDLQMYNYNDDIISYPHDDYIDAVTDDLTKDSEDNSPPNMLTDPEYTHQSSVNKFQSILTSEAENDEPRTVSPIYKKYLNVENNVRSVVSSQTFIISSVLIYLAIGVTFYYLRSYRKRKYIRVPLAESNSKSRI